MRNIERAQVSKQRASCQKKTLPSNIPGRADTLECDDDSSLSAFAAPPPLSPAEASDRRSLACCFFSGLGVPVTKAEGAVGRSLRVSCQKLHCEVFISCMRACVCVRV